MTWRGRGKNGSMDPTVYTGLMGTAFTCLRSYEATGNNHDLELCADMVDACFNALHSSSRCRCGEIASVVYNSFHLGIECLDLILCILCVLLRLLIR